MLRFADRNEHQKPTKHSEGAAAFDNMRGPGEHEELWGSRCRAFGFNNGVICRLSASTVLTSFVASDLRERLMLTNYRSRIACHHPNNSSCPLTPATGLWLASHLTELHCAC